MVDLDLRRQAVGSVGVESAAAPLGLLADSLARDLEPLLSRALPLPEHKARMTRTGGRCPAHGTLLDFDPWSPHAHRCAICDRDYIGREHDDWWAMGAQLWTVERAVHAAALFALRGDLAHAALASRILGALADRYASWPNRDNVLGPSRPFFSTYLESIWLLNVCHALSLLEAAAAPDVHTLGARVRDKLITPSSSIVAGYHEGLSNRQVWNEVAILSSLRMLDERVAFDARVESSNGFMTLLSRGLLDDGSWYEGENYHLFAHRGLWYGVELFKAAGRTLHPALDRRYRAGFVAPFVGVLPDDTFPSRRDSQYAVSLRQWRIAEWCELGYAHAPDARIAGVLSRIYSNFAGSDALAHNSLARARSTADAERNAPASGLTRADLSWRALLVANASPVPHDTWRVASGCLPSQGLAVLRRDAGRVYVALEGGHGGGGHGHPDRLALTLQTGADRWLEDPGTGSYTDRSLHWYRSTLAHAAPLVNGASQRPAPCRLMAFEERGGAGWIWKRSALGDGVIADRTIIVADGYLVDVLEWHPDDESAPPVVSDSNLSPRLTLAIANVATVDPAPAWMAANALGAGGIEDGFDFAQEVMRSDIAAPIRLHAQSLTAHAQHGTQTAFDATAWYTARGEPALFRATVPGAPGHGPVTRHWMDVQGNAGCIVGVWSWHRRESLPVVSRVEFDVEQSPVIAVTTHDGTRAEHRRAPHGWHIDLIARHARSSIDLEGMWPSDKLTPEQRGKGNDGRNSVDARLSPREESDVDNPALRALQPDIVLVEHDASVANGQPGALIENAWHRELGANAYIRTEESWREAGQPAAVVQLAATAHEFVLDVHALTGSVVCAPIARDNPLDNERDDVNADGLQVYFRLPDATVWAHALLVVPSHPDTPRISRLLPATPVATAHATPRDPAVVWRPTPAGWAMRLVWQRAQLPIDAAGMMAFDVLVNERPADRERRRGQLALSGGGGFGYLRGDRQDPAGAIRVQFRRDSLAQDRAQSE